MQLTESNKGSTIMRATQGIEFKPLIKTLVERNAVGMIVAPAKAKKSMLALNLVFSLLTKKTIFRFARERRARKDRLCESGIDQAGFGRSLALNEQLLQRHA